MKKYLISMSACFLFVCCNNNSDEPEEKQDTAAVAYSWEVSMNDSGRLIIYKIEEDGPDTLTVESVTGFVNKKYPNVQMQFVKLSGDTLYMYIPQPTYLTQQMGSTGPQVYFADAVYNLTEISGIRYVNFDFEEGDHASPAVLNRESFKED
jgi:hypothetical protein